MQGLICRRSQTVSTQTFALSKYCPAIGGLHREIKGIYGQNYPPVIMLASFSLSVPLFINPI